MGLMFTLVGLILSVFGLMTMGDPMYGKSGGLNANLDLGVVLLFFGGTMFLLGRAGQKRALAAPPKPAEPGSSRRGH